jgi:phosphatidylserine/phosphatidylglycerophosphate/cardiolipin synthase-like enzyme/uncharacterized membrane protein YdjX (TVP38/TMEM64 family)
VNLLAPGSTCFRVERADRASVLVDAAAYFSALRLAIAEAEHTVWIIGWDVDTRMVLDPAPRDGLPRTLLEFLNCALARRPGLKIHVLAWDFSVIYALERELLPSFKFASAAHPRLLFALDGRHQVGASHHQKLVVIDDQLAFCGGIDLTIRRWDTSEHGPDAGDRVDPNGEPYAPTHDVQLAVQGPIAGALGELARARWQRATGEELGPCPPRETTFCSRADPRASTLWPATLRPDFRGVQVAIARTQPSDSELHRDVREIEQLTLRAIAQARRLVFIENQYLTAAAVGDELCRRLAEPAGPEVLIILPRTECGWLEQSSMGVLRERMLRRLRQADAHGRLQVVYPAVPGLGAEPVNVHSKLLIVDDRLLKIGSANMSNRSLGLDTECDLAIEAAGEAAREIAAGIARVRRRLLAEHLALTPDQVARGETSSGGMNRFVASRRGTARCLLPVPEESAGPLNLSALEQWVVDPERPMAADTFIDGLLPARLQRPLPRALTGLGVLLLPQLVLGSSWHALRAGGAGGSGLAELASQVSASPFALIYVALGFVAAGFGLCPVTWLITLSVLGLGTLRGSGAALLGSLLSAAVFYWLGRLWGHVPLDYLRGPRMAKLRAGLRRRAVRATMAARLFPLGNFSAINLLAGALYVPFPAFMAGNLAGLLPGIVGLALCARQLERLLASASLRDLVLWLACVLGLGLGLWLCARGLGDVGARRPTPRRSWERGFAR